MAVRIVICQTRKVSIVTLSLSASIDVDGGAGAGIGTGVGADAASIDVDAGAVAGATRSELDCAHTFAPFALVSRARQCIHHTRDALGARRSRSCSSPCPTLWNRRCSSNLSLSVQVCKV